MSESSPKGSTYYRQQAVIAEAHAARSPDKGSAAAFYKIADEWRRLADRAEKTERGLIR